MNEYLLIKIGHTITLDSAVFFFFQILCSYCNTVNCEIFVDKSFFICLTAVLYVAWIMQDIVNLIPLFQKIFPS